MVIWRGSGVAGRWFFFTVPAESAPIAYQNKAVFYDLLFRAAAETLITIAAYPKLLGARIGATAVLHTWGSAMTPTSARPYDCAGRRDIAAATDWLAARVRSAAGRLFPRGSDILGNGGCDTSCNNK
jgi:hypothetical protein